MRVREALFWSYRGWSGAEQKIALLKGVGLSGVACSTERVPRLRSRTQTIQLASLILAQNERWRRA